MEILIVILLVILQFAYQLYTAAQRRSKRLRQGTIRKQENRGGSFQDDQARYGDETSDRGSAFFDLVGSRQSRQPKQERKSGEIDYAQIETAKVSGDSENFKSENSPPNQFKTGGMFDAFLRGGQQISKTFEDRFVTPIERAYDVMYDRDGVVVKELSNEQPEGKEVKSWYYSEESEEEKAADMLRKARQRLLEKKSKAGVAVRKSNQYQADLDQVANRVGAIKKMLKSGDRKKAIVLTEIISNPIALGDSKRW